MTKLKFRRVGKTQVEVGKVVSWTQSRRPFIEVFDSKTAKMVVVSPSQIDAWCAESQELPPAVVPPPPPREKPPTPKNTDARDRAIDKVEQGVDPVWMSKALAAVRSVAGAHEHFTTDDVWDELERRGVAPPTEVRAMGAVMRRASLAGVCTRTDRTTPSKNPVNHHRPVRVWRGWSA